ncbi:hypothetical protein [Allofranklinella schreckenbergeri]|uniref:hypothetical protein n=1 Tax=Allofranklinella schreckenbergeri TaxID=1076744 RepID=UPI001EEE0F6F|nr:hypothetical protein [Allofranklinella schreckenbergeri]
MALVSAITHKPLQAISKHTEVECTYTVVDVEGEKQLQLDTYGSASRDIPGKKSQSLRLNSQAIQQLKEIIKENGL